MGKLENSLHKKSMKIYALSRRNKSLEERIDRLFLLKYHRFIS